MKRFTSLWSATGFSTTVPKPHVTGDPNMHAPQFKSDRAQAVIKNSYTPESKNQKKNTYSPAIFNP